MKYIGNIWAWKFFQVIHLTDALVDEMVVKWQQIGIYKIIFDKAVGVVF
jgi:hypothetical protein